MSIAQSRPALAMLFRDRCASDVMTTNPLSLNAHSTVQEAAAFFTDKCFSAAPVIDRAGRPVGVVSRADVVRHLAQGSVGAVSISDFEEFRRRMCTEGVDHHGFQVAAVDQTEVGDIMTPIVFVVTPDATIDRIVQMLIKHKVHRLFVADALGVLVGVISTLDVLRHLQVEVSHEPSRRLRVASPVHSLDAEHRGSERNSAYQFG